MRRWILMIGLMSLVAAPALAGWVLTYEKGNMAYYEGAKFRTSMASGGPGGGSGQGMPSEVIMDANSGLITMLNPEKKTYYQGTGKDLGTEMKGFMEQMRAAMGGGAAMMGQDDSDASSVVTVKKLGSGPTIAGYATEHYEIHVDGEKLEEAWIAPKLHVMSDATAKKLAVNSKELASSMGMGMVNVDYTTTEEYLKLVMAGTPLKSLKILGMGFDVTTTVVKVEEKKVPAVTFEVPKGYKKVSFMELSGMSAMLGGRPGK